MGTNYYTTDTPPCETCGHGGEDLHIGKSSGGWAFGFRAYPERGLTSWAAWRSFLAERAIKNEYGDPVTLDDLADLIESKRGGMNARTAPASAWGPSGREGYAFDDEGHEFTEREFS